jgi:hypothetical protein
VEEIEEYSLWRLEFVVRVTQILCIVTAKGDMGAAPMSPFEPGYCTRSVGISAPIAFFGALI